MGIFLIFAFVYILFEMWKNETFECSSEYLNVSAGKELSISAGIRL